MVRKENNSCLPKNNHLNLIGEEIKPQYCFI
nr:MAG TPA: hypothetical protein [Bacteriophage sp.]